MFDAEPYIAEYHQQEPGQPRLRVLKKAIQAADEAHNDEWSFLFRERFLRESTFESDFVDGMVIFPEMMALYDRSEELQEDDEHLNTLLWCFKWVLGDAPEFASIPLEQLESLFAEFRKRLEANGKSLRPYYYLREKFSLNTGKYLPREEYGKYRTLKGDGLSDCKACEATHDVRIALHFGDYEKAEKLAAPILSGELSCAEIPQATYMHLILSDIQRGNWNRAKMLAKRTYPMTKHEMKMLDVNGTLLRLYASIDRSVGANIFRHELLLYLKCRQHKLRLKFAEGAYHLFHSMNAEEIPLILPKEFPLWNENNIYKTAEIAEYFYQEAKTLAERFDARNGTSLYMDSLNRENPEYDGDAVDTEYGGCEAVPSVMAAVCAQLPDELTVESVSRKLEADGRFMVIAAHEDEEQGLIAYQIAEGGGSENIYQVIVMVQPVPPLDDFRPASPVSAGTREACEEAEGCVFFVVPFEEKEPDEALHFQIRFINLICPDALAVLDISRSKLLPAGWVTLTAHSEVPPLVDYLYTLHLQGDEEHDHLYIRTAGLRCLGLRDLEILDADKNNYPRYADMLCFTAERILLRNELENAGTPFSAMRRENGTPVQLTWKTAGDAAADYRDAADSGWAVRTDFYGEDIAEADDNAVLYLYDGENPDGSARCKRLGTLTETDFEQFRYGQYIATGRKTAALARERWALFCALREKMPDNAYVFVRFEPENEDEGDEEIWVKVTETTDSGFRGLLTDDCAAGKAGDAFSGDVDALLDFSLRVNEHIVVHPNTAYIALDIE